MDNFDLRKFLADQRLLKEQQSITEISFDHPMIAAKTMYAKGQTSRANKLISTYLRSFIGTEFTTVRDGNRGKEELSWDIQDFEFAMSGDQERPMESIVVVRCRRYSSEHDKLTNGNFGVIRVLYNINTDKYTNMEELYSLPKPTLRLFGKIAKTVNPKTKYTTTSNFYKSAGIPGL